MYSKELIRGTLKTIVLKLLSEHGRMYGYEITQKVKEISSNEINLTFGALYPTLHKLEKEGVVTTSSEEVDNRTRKYYSLTSQGAETARLKIEEYYQFSRLMNLIMIS
ncbi:PadR family transcriptional regulator [Roseivirga sp. E12]|uniref:PadR family transcriptional regulator n=1 Tax=Roseivirga sp. E12 TaxID=2819237 RepID=UPI001ABC3341|nr:PadR family transcriptional regulator [Roseivirga sp. E12]MBO3698141.1 helix-turn-helix transcriptional regulator [Roseivirga sp. E12]